MLHLEEKLFHRFESNAEISHVFQRQEKLKLSFHNQDICSQENVSNASVGYDSPDISDNDL